MRFDIITAVPELLTSPFDHSILKRAVSRGLLDINIIDLRTYGVGKHNQIDDYQYGGGAGMVMMIEPIDRIITNLKSERDYDQIVYLTPDGDQWDQKKANHYSLFNNVILLCGHYKGIDERIREEFITAEISVGDFVLSGGELPAALIVDSIARLLPGVLNNESSALFDSYQDDLLAPPVYTRPADYKGSKVPDVLLSGNDKAIDDWRYNASVERTKTRRPDLLE
jgi:tRNA (guanine37-N1)-methyltransferase